MKAEFGANSTVAAWTAVVSIMDWRYHEATGTHRGMVVEPKNEFDHVSWERLLRIRNKEGHLHRDGDYGLHARHHCTNVRVRLFTWNALVIRPSALGESNKVAWSSF
jgi:hypothetical protein